MNVLIFNRDLEQLGKFDLGYKAYAFDVSRKSNGFVIIVKDANNNNLFLIGIDLKGNIQYRRDIITGNGSSDKNEIFFSFNSLSGNNSR